MKYPYGSGEVNLVSTEWVHENLSDLDIFDFQPNVHDYISEHIPSSVYFHQGLLRAPKDGVPAKYVSEEIIENLFQRLGVEKNTPTVVYTGEGAFKGWGDGLEQTMAAYTFARFGHNEVYLMDGGLEKWKKEDKEVEKDYTEFDTSSFEVDVRNELFIEYEDFKEVKDNEDVVLLDARPKHLYEEQGPWMKPGHIPGAVNLPWKSLMQDNPRKLRPLNEVKQILEKKGVTEDKQIICSCGTGREATNEFVLLNYYLNYPSVKLYEGSFTEWCAYSDNPTVTGSEPR